MTIKVKKEIETNVEISIPAFWKNPCKSFNEYVAIIDNNTVAKVLLMDNYCSIQNGTPGEMEPDLRKASQDFDLCTEVDFLSAYDEALQGMSLQPKLVTTDNIIDREAYNTIKAQNGF